MSFVYAKYLWFCLFALIPWIFYLIQILLANKKALPSIIFIQESSKSKNLIKKKILIYILQSLLLLLPGLMLAKIQFSSVDKYFCIVDDLVHSQWDVSDYLSLRAKYNEKCSDRFFSLASLSQNNLEQSDRARLRRNEPAKFLNVIALWRHKIQEDKILFFSPENNYVQDMQEIPNKTLYVISSKLRDKENVFFTKASLTPHPTDYRKRELKLSVSPYTKKKYSVEIERNDKKISGSFADDFSFNTILDVDFSQKKERITVSIIGDKYTVDNKIIFEIVASKPIAVNFQGEIPRTIDSIISLDVKSFPYQWFQKNGKGKAFDFGYYGTKLSCSNCISFVKHGDSQSPKKLVALTDNPFKKVLDENFISDVASFDFAQVKSFKVVRAFSDGNAAIVRVKKNTFYSGVFLFNPDSVAKSLKNHPAYPLYLLRALIDLTFPVDVNTLNTESESDLYFPELSRLTWQEKSESVKTKNQVDYIFHWHVDASALTNKPFPASLKLDEETEHISSDSIATVLVLLFFTILIILLILEHGFDVMRGIAQYSIRGRRGDL